MDMRIKVAAGVLIGVVSLLGTARAADAATVTQVRYMCDEGQRLVVQESGHSASVQFIDRTYKLRQKRSSVGRKYVSATAALIIDGASAVFVTENRLQLGQCIETRPVAAAE